MKSWLNVTAILKNFFFLLISLGSPLTALAQTSKSSESTPTFQLSGDAKLTSHFVYRGLSYTDQDPGLNAGFYFNLGPQFKFGVAGSNVKFDDTHLWLMFRAVVKVDFSSDVIMNLYYNTNRFYKSDSRNGTTIGTKIDIYSFRLNFDMESNWEGTAEQAQYLALSKTFAMPYDLSLLVSGGYTMQKSTSYTNYFDFKVAGLYKTRVAGTWELGFTMLSNGGQFGDRGKPFVALSTQFEF